MSSGFVRANSLSALPWLLGLPWLLALAAIAAEPPACRYSGQIDQAEQLMRQGQFREAVGVLEQVKAKTPTCQPDLYSLLAGSWFNLKEPEKALAEAEAGVRAYPDFLPLHEYYAAVVVKSVNAKEAIRRLSEVAKDIPSPVFAKQLGRLLFELEPENKRAGELLGKVAKMSPRDAEAHLFYAEWLAAQPSGPDALVELKQCLAVAASPSGVRRECWRATAVLEDRREHPAEAEAAFREAMKPIETGTTAGEASNVGAIACDYAEFLSRQGRDGEAEKLLLDVESRAPRFSRVHLDLGRILERRGDVTAALAQVRLAVTGAGSVAEEKRARILLSKLLHASGQEDEARVQQAWIAEH